MRIRNVKNGDEILDNCDHVVKDPFLNKGKWNEVFKKPQKIYVEFGMGKGGFISQLSKRNVDINYIGFEKYTSILAKSTIKVKEDMDNLLLVRMDVEKIEEIFEEKEVDRIYLNFSDPWPKDRHEKRRLTHKNFLDKYEKILNEQGEIHFKTDNKDLFFFSVDSFAQNGWTIKAKTEDLHNSSLKEDNVMTEYEEKFSSMGMPIYKLIATK